MSFTTQLALPPLSVAYGAATRLRLAAYRKGVFKTTNLNAPVISVGNITTGGTGKTPLVSWVSRVLAKAGRKVTVLTRGYGRTNGNDRVVVSDGKTILAPVGQSGDEPQLLAKDLISLAAVICDPNRAAAGQWAIDNLGSDAFVLDDGFQHLQLARDLNLLTIDATDPWGGGHLLPYGRLREERHGVSRADCAILTRVAPDADVSALTREIQKLIGGRPLLTSRMKTSGVRKLPLGQPENIHNLPQPIAAFCAVGNPEAFFHDLRRKGLKLAYTRTFRDHHRYTQADIVDLTIEARRRAAAGFITTAKDSTKLDHLEFDLPCYVLDIQISIDQEDKLTDLIRSAINKG